MPKTCCCVVPSGTWACSLGLSTLPGGLCRSLAPSTYTLWEAQTLHSEVVIKCLLNKNMDDGVSCGPPQ